MTAPASAAQAIQPGWARRPRAPTLGHVDETAKSTKADPVARVEMQGYPRPPGLLTPDLESGKTQQVKVGPVARAWE
jgi:hypothetical protein